MFTLLKTVLLFTRHSEGMNIGGPQFLYSQNRKWHSCLVRHNQAKATPSLAAQLKAMLLPPCIALNSKAIILPPKTGTKKFAFFVPLFYL